MAERIPRGTDPTSTRDNLLRAARQLFSTKGFGGTTVAHIARAARMTTGAIYHQFGDKLGLFRAVAEDVEREILAGVVNAAARAPASDRRGAITAGIEGMLDAVMAPDVQRIAFVEAPTVLGVRAWREIEARYAYGLLFDALSELEQAGSLKGLSATAVAPMILGALNEAATTIATSSNKKAARDASLLAIRRILEGIVGPPGTS